MYGRIKGTYAMIYDASGNKLFSIQKANAGNTAVVIADMIDGEMIPVRLTEQAEQLIDRKVKSDGHFNKIADAAQKGALMAKAAAFDWSNAGNGMSKKPLLVAGLALLGLLFIRKK